MARLIDDKEYNILVIKARGYDNIKTLIQNYENFVQTSINNNTTDENANDHLEYMMKTLMGLTMSKGICEMEVKMAEVRYGLNE